MSRSHRDQKNYMYKHHNEVCTYRWPWDHGWNPSGQSCICNTWHEWHWYNFSPPSWWNKDIRRKERAFTRNKMQRARAGSIDWADVDERRGDEWYW